MTFGPATGGKPRHLLHKKLTIKNSPVFLSKFYPKLIDLKFLQIGAKSCDDAMVTTSSIQCTTPVTNGEESFTVTVKVSEK